MNKHYPAQGVTTAALYNAMIKGKFTGLDTASYMANTCATRMSYALLRSGFNLPQTTDPKGSLKGEDDKFYWIRVADLRVELQKRFSGYDETLKFDDMDKKLTEDPAALAKRILARREKAQKFLDTKLANKNGIIVFRVKGWGDATGHFTLWNGASNVLAFVPGHDDITKDTYYPWLTELRTKKDPEEKFLIYTSEIQFWELK